ncbi:hypothetical protein A7D00_1672 [Trichophyton violaceum]|uniref:Hydrophobin n=1 Tax=Trichophyton violaceum TaxID=34388 RepID=A0A178FNK0_TRIVO|nr:hypothetical protein A7D00_1672 [Trichophyton violaceum]
MQLTALLSFSLALMGTANAQLWIPLNIPDPQTTSTSLCSCSGTELPPLPSSTGLPTATSLPTSSSMPLLAIQYPKGQQACSNLFPGSEPVVKADGSPKGCAPPGGFCTSQLKC